MNRIFVLQWFTANALTNWSKSKATAISLLLIVFKCVCLRNDIISKCII